MSNDRKYYVNHVPLDEEVHRRIVDQATLVGMRPADFVGYLTGERIKEGWKEPTPDCPEKYVDWQLMQMKQEERMKNQVFKAAALYQKYPSEKNAECLSRMCDAARMGYNEVIKKLDDDPFSSLYLYAKNGSELGNCMRWLSTFITERGGVVPARIVKVAATREGFSDSTLDRAKRTIMADADSPTIISDKRGKGWVWCIKELKPSKEIELVA